MLKAIRVDAKALEYVDHSLCDRGFLLEAVAQNPQAAGCVPVDVDEDIMNGWVEDCSIVHQGQDRDEVLRKVRRDGMWLVNATDFYADRDVVTAAVRQNGLALRFSHLVDDYEVVLEAVRENGMALQFASEDM